MEMIHEYAIYIYVVLISLILAILVVLLSRILKIFKTLASYQPELVSINNSLNAMQEKSQKISDSTEGIKFFGTIIGMANIAKQIDKNYKRSNSLKKSIAKTTVTNSRVVKTLENRAFDALFDKLMNY